MGGSNVKKISIISIFILLIFLILYQTNTMYFYKDKYIYSENHYYNNYNQILDKELNNQLTALNLININLGAIVKLEKDSEMQLKYIGMVLTSRYQLSTFTERMPAVFLDFNNEIIKSPLPKSIYEISTIGNNLTIYFETNRILEQENYATITEVIKKIDELIVILEEVAEDNEPLSASYDNDKVSELVDEINELLISI